MSIETGRTPAAWRADQIRELISAVNESRVRRALARLLSPDRAAARRAELLAEERETWQHLAEMATTP